MDLGADDEMTELVLASHRHDRTLLDVMLGNGDDLRDYVQYKLAIWEAIFNGNEEPTSRSDNGAAGATPAGKLTGGTGCASERRAKSRPRWACRRICSASDASPWEIQVRATCPA